MRSDALERESPARFVPIIEQALEAHLDRLEIKYSHSAIDITPAGVSKAAAVRFLLDLTGLEPEEVLGVGDTQADADWLRVVGHRSAPANGREALPGLDYYSPLPVIEGLLDILERLRAREWVSLGAPGPDP